MHAFLPPNSATNRGRSARFAGRHVWFVWLFVCALLGHDVKLSHAQPRDWGDAPDPTYPTLARSNGASHGIVSFVYLGALIDADTNGQPNLTATGDDSIGIDDDDGITFMTELIAGQQTVVRMIASTNGFIDAWFDYNANGSWEAGEKSIFSYTLRPGTNFLQFSIPFNAVVGSTFARFRFSRAGGLNPTGFAADGEVEDYLVKIQRGPPCERSNKGQDFWLTFPGNYAPDPGNPVQLTLCLFGVPETSVTVAIPGLGFITNIYMGNGSFKLPLPRQAELRSANDLIENKGIHVTSDQEIAVFAMNRVRSTSDGYLGLPSDIVGTNYIVQGYGNVHTGIPSLNGSQFAIVACESNTSVTIVPSVATGLRAMGVPYTITLHEGQTYQLRNTNDAPRDLSGTTIVATKPVGVFGGHRAAIVPTANYLFSDHLVEQLLPVERAGTNFLSMPLATRIGGDTFRFVATRNATTVRVNGAIVATLDQGQHHQQIVAGPAQITANMPIFVTQYANSSDFDNVANADAFMMVLQSTAQYLTSYMFCAPGLGSSFGGGQDTDSDGMADSWERAFGLNPSDPSDANQDPDQDGFTNRQEFMNGTNPFDRSNTVPHWEFTNYVNIVVPTSAIGSVSIDGTLVPAAQFVAIPGSGHSGAQVRVTDGVHFVSAGVGAAIRFGLTAYGYSRYDAYGYPAGMYFGDVVPPSLFCLVTNLAFTVSRTNQCRAAVPDMTQNVFITDNCSFELPPPVQTPPAGTLLPAGNYQLIVSVTDSQGNVGSCIIPMQITDVEAPTLSCPSLLVTNCTSSAGVRIDLNIPAVTFCGNSNYVVQCQPPSGTTFPPGTTRVNCQVTYRPGQTVSCGFDVIVRCISIRPRTPSGYAVSWTGGGALESATNVTGPWITLSNPPNPFPVDLSQRMRFFRVRYP